VRVVQHRSYRPAVVVRVYDKPPVPWGLQYQISGYYTWSDAHYVWINPTWMEPPVVGARWITSQWTFDDGQWNLHEVFWQEPPGQTVDAAATAPPAGWRPANDPAESVARSAPQPVRCYLSYSGTITFDQAYQMLVLDPKHDWDKLLEYIDGRGWVTLWGPSQSLSGK
jgi:hypothetical protein